MKISKMSTIANIKMQDTFNISVMKRPPVLWLQVDFKYRLYMSLGIQAIEGMKCLPGSRVPGMPLLPDSEE